jgi:hypothetical protein
MMHNWILLDIIVGVVKRGIIHDKKSKQLVSSFLPTGTANESCFVLKIKE